MTQLRIAILGDTLRGYRKHTTIAPALEAAADEIGVSLTVDWVPTIRLTSEVGAVLDAFDGAVAAPQSAEYCTDVDAMLRALTFARESGLCCLATCGGAQFALREDARSACGEAAARSLLREAQCEFPGDDGFRVSGAHAVLLEPGTLAAHAYGRLEVREHFACSYVPEDSADAALLSGDVTPVGVTPGVGASIFEWPDHPFYVATLFLPQWSPEQPHPLFVALLSAALARSGRIGRR